jgi:hypothetical protein
VKVQLPHVSATERVHLINELALVIENLFEIVGVDEAKRRKLASEFAEIFTEVRSGSQQPTATSVETARRSKD